MKRPVLFVLLGLLLLEMFFVFFPEPILLIWPDSIGYLGPVADALDSGRMTNWNAASGGFVYPLIDIPRYSAMQTPLFSLVGYAASLTLYTSLMRALGTTDA